MFEKLQRAFWKALTPDLVAEASAAPGGLAPAVVEALGGTGNLKAQQRVALTRVRVQVADPARVDEGALKAAGVPGVMVLEGGVVHLLVGLG
ncbi:PTS transporter subunit EIIB [Pseudomonas entomophila]|uniref:PTS transporter subunit EIIB n=1 Tax=Pseudomonas entomophila TaxID=312306 RepID=UPI0023D8AF06|nr:PTS transporter subunit EIIB [Pseudomonas entomophila]MDF0730420.1 PTS transporter subunit EIIB [Pseudomonas entomophila]